MTAPEAGPRAASSISHSSLRSIPHLQRNSNGNTHLVVKGKPFLMLAGELHNSSLSSAKYMSEVWPAMKAQSINTLLGSVSWEDIEPQEGQFTFTELHKILAGARQHQMHLVLLWFVALVLPRSTALYAPLLPPASSADRPQPPFLRALTAHPAATTAWLAARTERGITRNSWSSRGVVKLPDQAKAIRCRRL